MAAVNIHGDLGAQENKVCHCFHCFPIYFPWSDGTRCHDLSFLNLDFKPTFSLSSFTFIKRLCSSSSLSAIRVVSSAYLRLFIFLPPVLIPACVSSSPSFLKIRWAGIPTSLRSFHSFFFFFGCFSYNCQFTNLSPSWLNLFFNINLFILIGA